MLDLEKKELNNFLKNVRDKHILVVGDVMLDTFSYGNINRKSPEAPVDIVNIDDKKYFLGGAANVAKNISALGGTATILSIIGNDESAKKIKALLKDSVVKDKILKNSNRPTTTKERILSFGKHVIRIDSEIKTPISKIEEDEIISRFESMAKKIDVLVFSDYAKGVLTKRLVHKMIIVANKNNISVIVDTKPKNAHFFKEKKLTLLVPNLQEASEIAGLTDIDEVAKKILLDFNSHLLITKSEHGMSLYEKNIDSEKSYDILALNKNVVDVSGCGDTVCATLALSIATGLDLKTSVRIANYTASIVVQKHGTATVSRKEFINFYAKNK